MKAGIVIIGAGNMGRGLAIQFARHDHPVLIIDHRESNLDEATVSIRHILRRLAEARALETDAQGVSEHIDMSTSLASIPPDTELILESIPEDIKAKHDVFGQLDEMLPRETILASNTSGIPITQIATAAVRAPERVIGCHWWYPPYLLRPVEVTAGKQTQPEVIKRVCDLLERVNRTPIQVKQDLPGFVWNRVQNAVIRECLYLAKNDVASVEDINRAIRDGYARRTAIIGPFETMDIAGLEQFATVAEHLFPELNNAEEPFLFDEYLSAGRSGIDAQKGFLEYFKTADEVREARDRGLLALNEVLDTE